MLNRIRKEKGQDLLEFALLTPFFFLLTFSLIEFSLLYFQYSTIANAAREGARTGIVMPNALCDATCLDAQVASTAAAAAVGLNPDNLDIQVEHPSDSLITVVVTYDSGFITRMAAQAMGQEDFAVTLQAASTMRRER